MSGYASGVSNPAALTPTEALFLKATRHNWDHGTRQLERLLAKPECDRGTALWIYWHGAPEWYCQWRDASELKSPSEQAGFAFVARVEAMLLGREHPEVIRWDPAECAGAYADRAMVRELPPEVYEPSGGDVDGQALLDERRGPGALNRAALIGDVDHLEALLQAGFDVDAVHEQRTALSSAAGRDQLEAVQLLLAQGAAPGLRVEAHENFTALHFAVTEAAGAEVVRALLAGGASADQKAKWARTPLHLAVAREPSASSLEVVRAILEHGVTPDRRDSEGATPIHAASRAGRVDLIEALVEAGFDRHATDKRDRTALHYAANKDIHEGPRRLETIEALLALGLDKKRKDSDGVTPIAYAKEYVGPGQRPKVPPEIAAVFKKRR